MALADILELEYVTGLLHVEPVRPFKSLTASLFFSPLKWAYLWLIVPCIMLFMVKARVKKYPHWKINEWVVITMMAIVFIISFTMLSHFTYMWLMYFPCRVIQDTNGEPLYKLYLIDTSTPFKKFAYDLGRMVWYMSCAGILFVTMLLGLRLIGRK